MLAAYPLGVQRPEQVTTPLGIPLPEVTLEALADGRLDPDDLRATAATLRRQAEFARSAGRPQLAASLERAAELTAVPEDELLAVYTALRPGRATREELDSWARLLEGRGAAATAAFVTEAAEAYESRGLLAP